jgi:NTP pyrophosphatase (non-canonical NTP hydrolase)
MALAVEVAELMEHFRWLERAESAALDERKMTEARDEIGNVLIYLVRLGEDRGCL